VSRCNHYYLRSREDAYRKAAYWKKPDPARMLELSDDRFWNQVCPAPCDRNLKICVNYLSR
jgi:hypothetical protein